MKVYTHARSRTLRVGTTRYRAVDACISHARWYQIRSARLNASQINFSPVIINIIPVKTFKQRVRTVVACCFLWSSLLAGIAQVNFRLIGVVHIIGGGD